MSLESSKEPRKIGAKENIKIWGLEFRQVKFQPKIDTEDGIAPALPCVLNACSHTLEILSELLPSSIKEAKTYKDWKKDWLEKGTFWESLKLIFKLSVIAPSLENEAYSDTQDSGIDSVIRYTSYVTNFFTRFLPTCVQLIPRLAAAGFDWVNKVGDSWAKGHSIDDPSWGWFFGRFFQFAAFAPRALFHRVANVIGYASNFSNGVIKFFGNLLKCGFKFIACPFGYVKNYFRPGSDKLRVKDIWKELSDNIAENAGTVWKNFVRLLPEIAWTVAYIYLPVVAPAFEVVFHALHIPDAYHVFNSFYIGYSQWSVVAPITEKSISLFGLVAGATVVSPISQGLGILINGAISKFSEPNKNDNNKEKSIPERQKLNVKDNLYQILGPSPNSRENKENKQNFDHMLKGKAQNEPNQTKSKSETKTAVVSEEDSTLNFEVIDQPQSITLKPNEFKTCFDKFKKKYPVKQISVDEDDEDDEDEYFDEELAKKIRNDPRDCFDLIEEIKKVGNSELLKKKEELSSLENEYMDFDDRNKCRKEIKKLKGFLSFLGRVLVRAYTELLDEGEEQNEGENSDTSKFSP